MATNQWADFCISAVKYNSIRTSITEVQVREDSGESIGSPKNYPRQSVVNAIKKGTSFVTIYFENGMWNRGEDVRVININGVDYLRTDANRYSADNLGNLPEF